MTVRVKGYKAKADCCSLLYYCAAAAKIFASSSPYGMSIEQADFPAVLYIAHPSH